jgi:POT family proton-dependent oligopeptide transporter
MAGLQTDADALVAQSEVLKHQHEKPIGDSKSFIESSEEADDGIHDGLVFPTEEEKATLRRVSDTLPWNAYRACPTS